MIYLSTMILPKIIAMINKTKFKASTLVIRAFLFLLHAAITKITETSYSKKSIVIATENSDHNRVSSMSSLRQVAGKSFRRLIIWSDGMNAQFRSRFNFKLLASTLEKISWFYNEMHQGNGPMDGVGGTLKNVVFRKVKSGQTVVQTPEGFNIYQRKLRLQSRKI